MTYIDEMMKELCPDGVEWKELGEVCEIQRGIRITKNQLLPSGYPVVSGGTGYMGYTDSYNREAETITIAQYGTAGYVNIQKERFWANDVCFSVYPKDVLVNKYLYYVLANKQEYLYSISNRTAVPYSISKNNILKIKIPLPPLEIQEEIVKILDKFTDYVTELTAELTAELTLRQQQYSFYRDKLLSFDEDSSGGANNKAYTVQWKTLGEIAEPTQNILWREQSEQVFSYIDLSSVDRVSKKIIETTEITKTTAPSRAQRIVKENDIIFGTTRPTLKRYAKVTKEFDNQICSTGFYVFRASNDVLPNYVYHIFASNNFNKYIEEHQSGASYPAISNNLVEQYKLPVPSKSIQSRIVQVLDNFDTVCNDLNIGLPKEIELRQKQYEFFRDQLLTFAAAGVYTDSTVQYSTDKT